jgi:uncharacterized protein YuzE
MQFDYDKTTDSLYIKLAPAGSTESEEVSENLILDYDANGNVVGIDVQHASQRLDMKSIHVEGFKPKVEVQPSA